MILVKFSEFWSMLLKQLLKKSSQQGKKSSTDDLIGLITHSGMLERAWYLDLDIVKFHFYLHHF